jgi:hypothetical protein
MYQNLHVYNEIIYILLISAHIQAKRRHPGQGDGPAPANGVSGSRPSLAQ